MPTQWDHPDELFEVKNSVSNSSTVNLCDAIIRKANLLYEDYRGNRIPKFMENSANNFPEIADRYGSGTRPAEAYNLKPSFS